MESIVNKGKKLALYMSYALFVIITFLSSNIMCNAATSYYVDLNYSGTESGTKSQPFNTIRDALSVAACGDNIFLKPGVVDINSDKSSSIEIKGFQKCGICQTEISSEMLTVTIDPASSSTLVLKATGQFSSGTSFMRMVNNQCVILNGANRLVLDGSSANIGSKDSAVLISASNDETENVIFENVEILNFSGRGLSFLTSVNTQPRNIILRKNKIHGIQQRSIGGHGNGIYIEENEIWNSSISNSNQASGTSGWPGVVQMARYQTSSEYYYARNIFVRKNNIHDNWGEGVIMNFVIGGEVTDNDINNVFSVYIYLDHSKDILVSGNNLIRKVNTYNRTDKSTPEATGIGMAQESYSWASGQTPVILSGITISNNRIENLGKGINYWHDSSNTFITNTYENISITGNTISNLSSMPFSISEVPSSYKTPKNNELRDNIIVNSQKSIYIGNKDSWTLVNNNWYDKAPIIEDINLSTPADFQLQK